MAHMDLKDLDLNLLLVFDQLLVERRVSRVAENLGLSQPAVSNALARLRGAFGDELFLRTAQGMMPTAHAEQMAESISYALAMIRGAINQSAVFDPGSSQRTFVIGMTDIGEIYFLPRLLERLARDAPGISLSTVRNTAVGLKEDMEAGRVDCAVGPLPQLKAGFFQRRLFRQRYVCLFRKGHRLDRRRMTLDDFSAAEHLLVVSDSTGHGKVDDLLRRMDVHRRVRLTVPHFLAIGHILQSTDLVATVTERLAERMAEPFGLRCIAHPARLPDAAINLFWHSKYHRDPANQWLRGLFFDLFALPDQR